MSLRKQTALLQQALVTSLSTKILLATVWGLVLTISLLLNLSNSHWLAPDTMLFVGSLLAFFCWTSIMTFCLSQNRLWHASSQCFKALAVSAMINVIQIYS